MTRSSCSTCTHRNKHGICRKLNYFVVKWNCCNQHEEKKK